MNKKISFKRVKNTGLFIGLHVAAVSLLFTLAITVADQSGPGF